MKINWDSFIQVTRKLVTFRDERGWSKNHGPSMLATSLVVELGELFEHFLWKTDSEINAHISNPKVKRALEDEIADVMYHLIILSDYFHIDLGKALRKKLESNRKKYPIHKFKGVHGK